MTGEVRVRPLEAGEEEQARALTITAFEASPHGHQNEADLIEQLRVDDCVACELVAVVDGAVIGHALFSVLAASAGPPLASLGPVSVHPDRRRRGVAAALINEGLERVREAGFGGVVVLGDPAFYGRFGFDAGALVTVKAPFGGPAFQGLAFAPDAFQFRTIEYPEAFGVSSC